MEETADLKTLLQRLHARVTEVGLHPARCEPGRNGNDSAINDKESVVISANTQQTGNLDQNYGTREPSNNNDEINEQIARGEEVCSFHSCREQLGSQADQLGSSPDDPLLSVNRRGPAGGDNGPAANRNEPAVIGTDTQSSENASLFSRVPSTPEFEMDDLSLDGPDQNPFPPRSDRLLAGNSPPFAQPVLPPATTTGLGQPDRTSPQLAPDLEQWDARAGRSTSRGYANSRRQASLRFTLRGGQWRKRGQW